MMRLRSLLLTSAVALLSGAALAADIPEYVPPPPPPPPPPVVYDWTGFYIGAQGGWAWGESAIDITLDGLGFMVPPTSEFDIEGVFAGGQLGYDMQVGSWVFGLVGDGVWTDIEGFQEQSGDDGFETQLNWVASLRGRVGFALDRFLPYITGGFAFGEMDSTVGDTDGAGNFDPIATGGAGIATGSEIATGWTAGGGIEVGVLDWLSIGSEYRYTDVEADFDETADTGAPEEWTADARFHSIRAFANLRF
jgi:outer membrane immunogenic protein